VFAVVITGPPGAGKTSVLTALVDALTDEDVAHAAIELETLAWTHPALSDDVLQLYVVPQHRGHGLGRALMEAAIDFARREGADEMH
jgi:GNAT superfamily N-acetyltransferase